MPAPVPTQADIRAREQDIFRRATPKDYSNISYSIKTDATSQQQSAQTAKASQKSEPTNERHAPTTTHPKTVARRIKYRLFFADAFPGDPVAAKHNHGYDSSKDGYYQRMRVVHAQRDAARKPGVKQSAATSPAPTH